MLPCTTAVIVNFFSAGLTLQAADSILNSVSAGPVRLIIVDNSCDQREKEILQTGLQENVELVVNSENVGFGRACNQIFKRSDDDFFLLLNPDAYLVGDALKRLQQTLMDNPKTGAVSPRAFWDQDFSFFIPPAHSPFLFFTQPGLSRGGPNSILYNFFSRLWRRYSLKAWKSKKPIRLSNLCGGHVLLKRKAVLKSGGLFDPRFFLYFEDTDLFLRLRKMGFNLVLQPEAVAVHHYNQCAQDDLSMKHKHMAVSYQMFMNKNLNYCYKILNCFLKKLSLGKNRQKSMGEIALQEASYIAVPQNFQRSWLFEWSPNEDFIPSVGYFGQGGSMYFPGQCLNKLAPGKYYMRFSEPRAFGRIGPVYTWTKKQTTQYE